MLDYSARTSSDLCRSLNNQVGHSQLTCQTCMAVPKSVVCHTEWQAIEATAEPGNGVEMRGTDSDIVCLPRSVHVAGCISYCPCCQEGLLGLLQGVPRGLPSFRLVVAVEDFSEPPVTEGCGGCGVADGPKCGHPLVVPSLYFLMKFGHDAIVTPLRRAFDSEKFPAMNLLNLAAWEPKESLRGWSGWRWVG